MKDLSLFRCGDLPGIALEMLSKSSPSADGNRWKEHPPPGIVFLVDETLPPQVPTI